MLRMTSTMKTEIPHFPAHPTHRMLQQNYQECVVVKQEGRTSALWWLDIIEDKSNC
jgi:hypothetical protein